MASFGDIIRFIVSADGQPFRDDMKLNELSFDELIASLRDKDLTIEANMADADAKLDNFKSRLLEIKNTTALIHTDDADAQKEVDKLKLKLDDIVYRALKITADDSDAVVKIEDLRVKLDKLRTSFTKLPIGVEDGSALEKIDAIKADLDTLHGKTVPVNVDTKPAAQGMGILGTTILNLLPLLSPLSVGLAGSIIGLSGMFTTASMGAIGFGTVAKSNLSDVFAAQKIVTAQQTAYNNAVNNKQRQAAMLKAKQAWDSLDVSQQQAMMSLQGFKKFWEGFSASFEKPVLSTFTNGMTLLEKLLVLMGPTIKAAGDEFAKLEADASKALGSPFWAQFFKWMSKDTASSINSIGVSIGNIMKGLAGMFMAFSPGQKSMEKGLVNLTARFAQWGATLDNNTGFQKFVQYFLTNGPKVMSLLGQLTQLIVNLLVAMAPWGSVLLGIVDGVLKLANALLTTFPHLTAFSASVFGVYGMLNLLRKPFPFIGTAMDKLGGVFSRLMGVLLTGIKAIGLAFITNPIGIAITAVVAVIAIAALLFHKHLGGMKQIAEDVWKAIQHAVQAAISFIGPYITSAINTLAAYWKSIWPELLQVFKMIWEEIKLIFAPAVLFLVDTIKVAFAVIKAIWQPFWNMLGSVLKAAWDVIVGHIRIAWDLISGIFKVALDLITGHWKQAWTDFLNIFKNVGNDIVKLFSSLANDALNFGKNFMSMIIKGVTAEIGSLNNAVKGAANTLKHWLGFHSPSAGLPDSGQWAPNFMKMFASGLNDNVPLVDAAAQKATTSLKNQHNKRLANQAAAHQKALQRQQQTAQKMQQQRQKAAQQAQQQTQTDNLKLQNIYQAYSQTMLNLRNNYAKQAAAIEDGLVKAEDAAMQKYTQAVDSRAQQLQQSMGLFSSVTHKQVSAQTLLGNIQDQVSTFEGWTNNLAALTKRGVDQGFLAELQKAGPQAADEVKALASMTDGQLQNYVNLWQKQSKDAHDEAVNELAPMKADTEAQIEALKKAADQKLQELTKTFDTNMANAKQKSLDQIKMLEQTAPPAITKAVQKMGNAMTAQLGVMLSQAQSYVAQINAVLSSVGGGLAPNTASMVQNGSRSTSSVANQTITIQHTTQINGAVYGVNDLQAAIKQGVQQHVVPALQAALGQPARALTGVRP